MEENEVGRGKYAENGKVEEENKEKRVHRALVEVIDIPAVRS